MSASCTKQPPHTIEAYSWVGLINVKYDLEKCSLPILSLNFLKSYFFLYLEFTIPSMSSDQLRFCDNKWRWVGRNSTLSPWKNNLGKTELCFLVKKTTSYVHTFTTHSLCFSLYISLFPSFTHNNGEVFRHALNLCWQRSLASLEYVNAMSPRPSICFVFLSIYLLWLKKSNNVQYHAFKFSIEPRRHFTKE